MTAGRRKEILRTVDGRIVEALPLVPGLYRIVVCMSVGDAMLRLERCADVRYAEPNSLFFPASPSPGAG